MSNEWDEGDVKKCPNKRCKRKDMLVIRPNSRYCSECGAKMKIAWGTVINTEQPPFIDMAPDVDRHQRPKNGPVQQIVRLSELKLDYFGFKDAFLKDKPGIEVSSNIVWDAYEKYTKDFELRHSNSGGSSRPSYTTSKISDEFTCDADLEGCPLMGKSKDRLIRVPYNMFNTWVWLALRNNTEWIAYLMGACDEAGVWTINDMYFPKQRANGAHVDAEDGEIREGTIGSVHSHVAMSAFFSTEDKNHFNHQVEMVVNRNGNMAACVRVRLECGKYSRIDTTAVLLGEPMFIDAEKALTDKLSEDKAITSTTTYHGTGSQRVS